MAMSELNRCVAPEVFPLRGMKLPDVQRIMLENGVELVWLNHGSQPVNRMMITWRVGAADVECQEALHLLRMLLPEGTKSFTGEQMAETFEYNGAWIRVEAGMHVLSITVHSLNKTVAEILPSVMEMIMVPTFPQENMVSIRAKEAAACDLRRKRVVQKALELSRKLSYGEHHPLSRVETGKSIQFVERAQIVDIHERIMLSSAPVVYLAGQIDDALLKMVCNALGSLRFSARKNAVACTMVPFEARKSDIREVDVDASSLQTAIRMSMPTITRAHDDYESLRFTVFAFGGYFGSRLMSNIREDKGYTYGINASLASLKEGAHISVNCQCDNKYSDLVLDEINNEVKRLSSELMDEEELQVVKSTAMSSLTAVLDSPFSIMDYYALLDSYGIGGEYYGHQLKQLEELTLERVRYCAEQYIADAPQIIALAGNPCKADV